MSKQKEALDYIRKVVWAGLDFADVIFFDVTENLTAPGELDPQWVRQEIDREFARKAEAALSWPEVTDCDWLDRVFAALQAGGILVVQNAGYTRTDGWEEVENALEDYALEDDGESVFVGYCFYHGQHLARAIASGELCLAFGNLDGPQPVTEVEVGRRIQRAFVDAGFAVEWDGTDTRPILLTGIRWLRRAPLN